MIVKSVRKMTKMKGAKILTVFSILICVSFASVSVALAYYDPVQVQIFSDLNYLNYTYEGQGVGLEAIATDGSGSYLYQWYSNDQPIPYATYATTYYSPVAGTYTIYCTAKDANAPTLAPAISNYITMEVKIMPPSGGGGPVMATGPNSSTSSSSNDSPGVPTWVLPTIIVILAVVTLSIVGLYVKRLRRS